MENSELLPCHITVTIERDYGECGHMDNGCSGWESIEITASDGTRTEKAKSSGCFGVSEESCFQKLMNKWFTRTPAERVTVEEVRDILLKELRQRDIQALKAKHPQLFKE